MSTQAATSRWTGYLPALESALRRLADSFEAVPFDANWTPEHRTEGLVALSRLREGWMRGQAERACIASLYALLARHPDLDRATNRATLGSVEGWMDELEESLEEG